MRLIVDITWFHSLKMQPLILNRYALILYRKEIAMKKGRHGIKSRRRFNIDLYLFLLYGLL